MKRLYWLAVVILGSIGPGSPAHAEEFTTVASGSTTFPVRVSVSMEQPGARVNRKILGNNVQWVDRGDELLAHDGAGFAPEMLSRVERLAPAVLRYPGGSLSDLYHWRDGIGPLATRGTDEHFFSGQRQPVLMGTDEFLSLCARLHAAPMITVNTVTGSPTEAAQWLAYTNRLAAETAHGPLPIPRVRYWEIGNEPYLKDPHQPGLWVDPTEFARRANRYIRALRQQDPDVLVGVPLRSDFIGGKPANPNPGYNAVLLRGIDHPTDFVALHDAYLPFLGSQNRFSKDRLYWASMAASYTVADDLSETRRELDRAGWRNTRLAVSEYSPMYTLSGGETDAYIASLAGALYVADLLRVFAGRPDLMTAEYWSLTGNGNFGTVSNRGITQPVYGVLEIYNRLLHGQYVPLQIDTATRDVIGVGYVSPAKAVPLVSGLATRDRHTARMLLLNKDPLRTAQVLITAGEGKPRDVVRSTVFGATVGGVFGGGPMPLDQHAARIRGRDWVAALPPHSLTLFEWHLDDASRTGSARITAQQ